MSTWFINYKQPRHLLQLSVRGAFISSSRDHCNDVTFWGGSLFGRETVYSVTLSKHVCREKTWLGSGVPGGNRTVLVLSTQAGVFLQVVDEERMWHSDKREPQIETVYSEARPFGLILLHFHPPCMCKQGLNFCEILTNISICTVSLLVPALKRECTKERHESLTPP